MSIVGIGLRLAGITTLYTASLAGLLQALGRNFLIPLPQMVLIIGAGVLLLVGIPFFAVSLVTLLRGFPTGRLLTSGVYKACRNPLYASFICFLVPGAVLLTGSWPFLSIPFVLYATFRKLIRQEEDQLEQTFGQAYLDYKATTPRVVPRFRAFFD